MNRLRHQNYKNENTDTKKPLVWLVNQLYSQAQNNGGWC